MLNFPSSTISKALDYIQNEDYINQCHANNRQMLSMAMQFKSITAAFTNTEQDWTEYSGQMADINKAHKEMLASLPALSEDEQTCVRFLRHLGKK